MYKVCTASGCDESTILVGLDAAIKDGVDVLSISLDTGSLSIDYDPVAVGTFSAVSRGIVVVCAAGNDGPVAGSVTNDAPWLLTVAAGSVDRSFRASVHLSNGKRIDGEALTQVTKSSSSVYPLHYEKERLDCNYNDVDNSAIFGKIVVCDEMGPDVHPKIHHIMGAGAAGVVLSCYEGYTTVLRNFNSSVVQVTPVDGEVLETSAATSMGATFTYNNTLLGVQPSPVVASFSSRGPSPNTTPWVCSSRTYWHRDSTSSPHGHQTQSLDKGLPTSYPAHPWQLHTLVVSPRLSRAYILPGHRPPSSLPS
jgi:subtilisin family serine protease